jgi:hypothetical protein
MKLKKVAYSSFSGPKRVPFSHLPIVRLRALPPVSVAQLAVPLGCTRARPLGRTQVQLPWGVATGTNAGRGYRRFRGAQLQTPPDHVARHHDCDAARSRLLAGARPSRAQLS